MSHQRNISSSRRPDSRRRRAYILIAVLGIATVAASVGVAYLEANSTSMPEADNRFYKMRAQYLAESGAELAKHYLLYPPTTVALDSYWTGGSNIAIDATSDSTSVTVTPHATQKDRYKIVSGGIAKDFTGAVRGKKSVTADVVVPPVNKWSFTQAMLASSSIYVPSKVRINGDVQSNGTLSGAGYCSGTISASGAAFWIGGGAPSIVNGAAAVAMAQARTSYYKTYTLNGQTYNAYTWSGTSMTAAEATALNAVNMTSTNPGRVIAVPTGTFRLRDNASLNGTLLVAGTLEFDDKTIVTAVSGFPAAVVNGDVNARANGSDITFNGSLICAGTVNDNNQDAVKLDVNGAAVLWGSITTSASSTLFTFTYDSSRSWFYNLESTAKREPITVVKWTEN